MDTLALTDLQRPTALGHPWWCNGLQPWLANLQVWVWVWLGTSFIRPVAISKQKLRKLLQKSALRGHWTQSREHAGRDCQRIPCYQIELMMMMMMMMVIPCLQPGTTYSLWGNRIKKQFPSISMNKMIRMNKNSLQIYKILIFLYKRKMKALNFLR